MPHLTFQHIYVRESVPLVKSWLDLAGDPTGGDDRSSSWKYKSGGEKWRGLNLERARERNILMMISISFYSNQDFLIPFLSFAIVVLKNDHHVVDDDSTTWISLLPVLIPIIMTLIMMRIKENEEAEIRRRRREQQVYSTKKFQSEKAGIIIITIVIRSSSSPANHIVKNIYPEFLLLVLRAKFMIHPFM